MMGPVPEGDSDGPTSSVTNTISTGRSFLLPVTIDRQRVDFVIDTGSGYSILRKDIWEGLPGNQDLRPCDRQLVGVSGDSLDLKGTANITMEVQGKIFILEVIVVNHITTGAILGLDFMSKEQCVLNVGHGTLRIDSAGIEVPLSRVPTCGDQEPSVCRQRFLHLVETTLVPAQSELEVLTAPGETLGEGTWLIEGKSTSPHVLIARVVAQTSVGRETTPIRLLNLGPEPVKLYKGTTLATATQVSPSDVCEPLNGSVCAVSEPLSQDLRDALWASVSDSDSPLTHQQRDELFSLLSKYSDVFATHTADFGRTGRVKHEIPTGSNPPIRQAFRRVPPAQRRDMTVLLKDMQAKDVIHPSSSPWASPVVLVKKKDGSVRFCVDYRKVNAVTRKDAYPLPRIDDTLDTLAGSKWFTTLDLISGYWQVEVDPKDQPKTAFSTPDGLFEFNVMPFGLCNAPATFQRLMDMVLAGLQWTMCLVYLDDVIVMGRTFEEHLTNLANVLTRLRDANLRLKPQKCAFARQRVTFLGHVVSPEGVATDPEKTRKVREWPQPTSVKEVRQFLGLVSYYRRFIKDFSQIAKPLHRLTEKTSVFVWTEDCEDAFQQLRTRLVTSPILAFPDHRRPFILDTDASDVGIGAVLSQVQDDGVERVIAYASRVLTKAERRYCVTRKELLAVVTFVQYFRPYLLGSKFTLRTDHGSLRWLWNFKEPQGQLARWLEKLQEFDFSIEHRRGRSHGNADALSRLPCRQCGRDSHHVDTTNPVFVIALQNQSVSSLRESQLADDSIGPLLQGMEEGQKPLATSSSSRVKGPAYRRLLQMWDQLVVRDGLLFRQFEDTSGSSSHLQLVVPAAMRKEVLADLHSGAMGGHLGEDKTLAKLKERYYWPGHHNDVAEWCKTCPQCAARKNPTPKGRAPLQPVMVGYPLQLVAVDILGPLPDTPRGNRYLLVVADYFTRWTEAYPIPNQEAITVARVLTTEFFLRFSPPEQLHSDQGRQFESEVLAEVCKLLGVKKSRTTPYHPQSDGLVERFNRTLLSMLATSVDRHQEKWEDHVRSACMAYNTSQHPTTGYSPFYLMFGRKARMPIELTYGCSPSTPSSTQQYAEDLKGSLEKAYTEVRNNFSHRLERQKDFYDRKVHGEPFAVGTLVWLHSPVVARGKSRKLHHPWTGPYRVIKRISEATYRIQNTTGNRKRLVVHFDRLKACHPNTRIESTGTAIYTPPSRTPQLPPTPAERVIFEEQLELVEPSDSPQVTSQGAPAIVSGRYPQRQHSIPDRYGAYVSH